MRASTRATLGLGLGLATTVAVVLWIMHVAIAPARPLERKFRDADREVLYEIGLGSNPRLALARGERTLYLVTHAVLREETPVDGSIVYGIDVRVTQPSGEVVVARELWARSRRSRGRLEEGVWLDENAFSAEGLVLADDRVVELALPEGVEDGAILELSPATSGEAAAVLFRAYRRVALADATSGVRRLALTDHERERLASAQGVPRWEALPEEERALHVASGWQRLPALGEDGVEYRTRTIFYTGFRSPRGAPDRHEPRFVDAYHALAWNVEGPARLTVRSAGDPVTLWVQGEAGDAELRLEGGVEFRGERRTLLELGAGVHTVVARVAGGRASVLLTTSTLDEGVPFGASPRHEPVDGERLLEPDVRWLPTYRTDRGHGLDEVCWAVDGGGDFYARTLRLDVRSLLHREPYDAAPVDVSYRFLDARGSAVASGAGTVEGTRSDFEWVRLGDDSRAQTTEPVALRFVAPARATAFCAATAVDAALRAYTLMPGHAALDAAYAAHQGETARWRYAPMQLRAWLPLRAIGHATLAAAGRIATLAAQTRLEPTGEAGGGDEDDARGRTRPPDRDYAELEPQGRPQRDRVLEVVDDARSRTSGVYTALGAAEVAVRGRAGASETRGLYWLDEVDALGRALAVREDGHTLFETVLRARAAPFSLPPIGEAPRALRVDAPPSAHVFVEGAPASPRARGLALRTVFQMPRGAPLRVSVPARARHLWVVLYAQGSAARADLSLRARLDDGAPSHAIGVPLESIRRPEHAALVPASDRPPLLFVDRRDVGALRARSVRFLVGDDLSEAPHAVDVWLDGLRDEVVSARFLVEDRGGARPGPSGPVIRRSTNAEEGDDD